MTDGPQQLTGYRLRDYDDLIARLGESRRTQGMSQHALARAAHVGHQQLGKWLTGSTWPLAPNLVAVVEALGYDLALIPRQPSDGDAPRTALSATESAKQGAARGSGCTEPPETRCGNCGSPHGECPGSDRCTYPPLQETYPGSGIYE